MPRPDAAAPLHQVPTVNSPAISRAQPLDHELASTTAARELADRSASILTRGVRQFSAGDPEKDPGSVEQMVDETRVDQV